jgi:hypothetical protein
LRLALQEGRRRRSMVLLLASFKEGGKEVKR